MSLSTTAGVMSYSPICCSECLFTKNVYSFTYLFHYCCYEIVSHNQHLWAMLQAKSVPGKEVVIPFHLLEGF